MGFFGKLFGTATAAGAGVVGVKVAEKVKENNPNGVGDVNSDGKVDYADYLLEVEKAAKELYGEAAPVVKETAQKKIDELKLQYPDAVSKIDGIMDNVKAQFADVKDQVKDIADQVNGK